MATKRARTSRISDKTEGSASASPDAEESAAAVELVAKEDAIGLSSFCSVKRTRRGSPERLALEDERMEAGGGALRDESVAPS